MSSRTSSRSTLTMTPSTMSPSLKYLMVESIAARKSSSDPMSLTATWGATWMLLVMWWRAPKRTGVVTGATRARARRAEESEPDSRDGAGCEEVDRSERAPAPSEVAQAHDAGDRVSVGVGQGQSAHSCPRRPHSSGGG